MKLAYNAPPDGIDLNGQPTKPLVNLDADFIAMARRLLTAMTYGADEHDVYRIALEERQRIIKKMAYPPPW